MNVFRHIVLCVAAAACPVYLAGASDGLRDTLEIAKAFQARPEQLLEGRVSGVGVFSANGSLDGGMYLQVRGLNAVRSDSQPLWVVDGVPTIGVLDLNPYDIESIEVLKDLSATAVYGPKGANGVVLVQTKRKRTDGLRVDWHSNAALSLPATSGATTRAALSHNHSVRMESVRGQSLFSLGGRWRTDNEVLQGNAGRTGLVNLLYETRANPVVWFSTNTMIGVGGSSSTTGDWRLGDEPFLPDDYDNDALTWRIFNASSLSLNFTPSFSLQLCFGVDYRNRTTSVWFGNGTARGKAANGEAIISGDTFLRYYACPEISWRRFFGQSRVAISGGGSVSGDYNRTNVMRGTDFFSHELRAKGLNLQAGKSVVDTHSLAYFSYGAYLKAGYGFGDLAGLDALLRLDHTPEYDDSPSLYYGVQAFYQPWEFLKVTAGYGVAGFEQVADYPRFDRYVTGPYTQVDPTLTYYYKGLNRVRSQEATAGVESTLPGGRVHLAAKFFYKQTTDAFLAYCFGRKTADTYLWRYSSRTPYFDTASAFYTTGVEFDADAVLVDRDDFRWTAGLNFTWMTGRMTQKGELDLNGQDVGSGLIVNKLVAGRPVAEFYNTQTSLGSPVPGILGGLTTTVRWWQFIVEADLSGAALFQVVDLSSVVIPDAGPVVLDKDCVRSGDYLKLGRLSLAYDLIPAGMPFIRRIRFSLSGNNLLLLAARTDIPPMLDYFGWNGATSGMAFAAFPYARSIVAGISVTF